MRRPAGILEHGNLVVERLPFSTEHMSAGNDHVDLVGASLDGTPDLRDSLGKRRKSGRESRRDRGYVNPASFDSAARRFDERMVNANSCHFDFQTFDAQLLYDFLPERLTCFGAKPKYTLIRIVTGK